MKIQDLKNNRNEIINKIRNNYPSANVNEFMNAMVRILPMAEANNTDDYVTEVGDLIFAEKTDNKASEWLAAKNRENAMRNAPSSMR